MSAVPRLVDVASPLVALRREVSQLEAGGRVRPVVGLGLPGLGLATGVVHACAGDRAAECAAALGFAAVAAGALAAARPTAALVWIAPRVEVALAGLAGFGVPVDRLITVTAAGTDALWAMEEALRSPEVGVVIAELATSSLTAARRLQLAAEAGGATGLAVAAEPMVGAHTIWRIAAAPALPAAGGGVGRTRWRVDLVRGRGRAPQSWDMEWTDGRYDQQPHHLRHPAPGAGRGLAPVRDRPVAPAQPYAAVA
jgi:protein ImuA